jgi:hypothetical protein
MLSVSASPDGATSRGLHSIGTRPETTGNNRQQPVYSGEPDEENSFGR